MKWLALDYIATTKSCVSTAFFPGAGMSFFFFFNFLLNCDTVWSLCILEGLVSGPRVVTRIRRYSSSLYKMVLYSQPSMSTGANCIYRKVYLVISVWLPFHTLWTHLCNQQPDEGTVHYSTPDIPHDLFWSLPRPTPWSGHCPNLPLHVLVQPVFLLLFLSEVCKKMALWALASAYTAFAWRLFSYNLDLWFELFKLFCGASPLPDKISVSCPPLHLKHNSPTAGAILNCPCLLVFSWLEAPWGCLSAWHRLWDRQNYHILNIHIGCYRNFPATRQRLAKSKGSFPSGF